MTSFSAKNQPHIKIVSEDDQEIPQSQTADNPVAPRRREPLNHHETPGRQIKQSNQLSKVVYNKKKIQFFGMNIPFISSSEARKCIIHSWLRHS